MRFYRVKAPTPEEEVGMQGQEFSVDGANWVNLAPVSYDRIFENGALCFLILAFGIKILHFVSLRLLLVRIRI